MPKSWLWLPLITLAIPNLLLAQSSQVQDVVTMQSDILGGERNYAVYLPPGYDSSKRSYPVLYLLHGSGDDQSGWIQFGEVQHIADQAIANGTATSLVIIMPDGDTGRKGYFNDIRGDWRYEDFFFEELMPHVEMKYRIRQEKRYRAIAGLSMGGGGTLMYALHHPELFSAACPLSASTGPLTLEDAKRRYTRSSRRGDSATESQEPLSDQQIEDYFQQHSAVELVNQLPDDQRESVRWFIDCGDDDFLYEGNSMLHIAMRKKQIPHEYRVREGAHNWTYWRQSLPNVLEFVSQSFHQH
ncbi:alpha/beta hydrolase [Aureliella helgolandensis]|uniref:Endo-1,4-beta-xylanase Z n=1 Tax=Aureliella helgolandensis TaxID=2527968 RepID=A0A518G843_9BACT|nr:alpha/beta hydrolase-fold protein [Aureliella helgolandensis]QDV24756.1 Endo-1,4-beta-xylanase Z precursor [Aureliella helgolandensis]